MFYDKLNNLQNVRANGGGVAILTLPLSVTYDKIKLKLLDDLTAADITRIEGKANGKAFFVDTGARRKGRQDYKGIHTEAGFLTLDFTEPNARGGAVPQYLASIPANLLKSLTFEITIGAAGVGETFGMEAYAEFRGPTNNPFIAKNLDFNVSLPNAGEHDLFLPSGVAGGIIKRVWLHHTGHITAAELRVNRVTAINAKVIDLEYQQKENNLVPQANVTVLDFVVDGNLQGALNTAGNNGQSAPSVELRLTTDAADVVSGYIEYIDPLNRL
jgi:hypothetical protein